MKFLGDMRWTCNACGRDQLVQLEGVEEHGPAAMFQRKLPRVTCADCQATFQLIPLGAKMPDEAQRILIEGRPVMRWACPECERETLVDTCEVPVAKWPERQQAPDAAEFRTFQSAGPPVCSHCGYREWMD